MDFKQWLAGNGSSDVAALKFQFDLPLAFSLCLLLIALSGFLIGGYCLRHLKSLKKPVRWTLTGLRACALMLAVFLLLRPTLVGNRFDPARNYLLMLYDNSLSMSLKDGETTRGQRLQSQLSADQEVFEEKLKRRYQLAHYGFGSYAERLRSPEELTFDRLETRPLSAVESALRDFQGIEVSAIILFSDGIPQPGSQPLPDHLSIPVITVGVGSNFEWRDLAMAPVSFTRGHGDQRPVHAKVTFSATGLEGRRARVEILDNTEVVAFKTLEISSPFETHEVTMDIFPKRNGWLEYQARIGLEPLSVLSEGSPASNDLLPENNERRFLVDNRKREFKILYFNGRPNWENKFIQRALKEDEEIELTNIIRISAAETKFVYRGKKTSLVNPLFEGFFKDAEDQPRYDEAVFLRFGGDRESAGKGFPEDASELFSHDLVIIGDVEAGFFSQSQLELIREFVRKRGGSLLLLGGPHSFSEGGYQGTVLEGLLPVMLEKRSEGDPVDDQSLHFKAVPTLEGLLAGSWALDPNPQENRKLWLDLPELTGINRFPIIRPGASVLARPDSTELDTMPLFAVQRYGEGRSAILATGATWFWHMQTQPDDNRHARFWRQVARGLSMETAVSLYLRNKESHYVEGKPIDLDMVVRDRLFNERSGMQIRLEARGPDGSRTNVPVDESLTETGLYTGHIALATPGVHYLNTIVTDNDNQEIGSLEEAILVEKDQRELQDPKYRTDYLESLASASGGRFFTLDRLSEIPDRIPWLKNTEADQVRFPIWHFPGFYFLLALMLPLEWYLRRTRGRA